jgi:CubicO group peptidase (beta-lactamase class C family)
MDGPDRAHRVLVDAHAARVFPSATAEVGQSSGVIWNDAVGTRTFEPSASVDLTTPYDLASLTKVIATTTVGMQLVHAGAMSLEAPLGVIFREWSGADRRTATVGDLLEHASGLPARFVDAPPHTAREFLHDICSIQLEYNVRERSIYSDLGFILLGFGLEQIGNASLGTQFERVWSDRGLTFDLAADAKQRAAPTLPLGDDARRGRRLTGVVHDNYAARLGGVAGHAGLFGDVAAVGRFAGTALRAARGGSDEPPPFTPALMTRFAARSTVPGSSRALGWDTMLPTSSCGTQMSAAAIGHVGYTGTSLWIDPQRDRYFVLLTNRACGGGTLDAMRDVRRAFHDALRDV